VPNQKVKALAVDHLYHLGLDTSMPLKKMFGDTKFVCMGGSAQRMQSLAQHLLSVLNVELPVGTDLATIGKTERFSMYKVGPVICVNHGMGQPSISILLHEIAKLLMYAGASGFTFIRIGTSGGIGCQPGTVVITEEAVDGQLRPQFDIIILGKVVSRPTHFDRKLCERVLRCAGDVPALIGKTMSCDDFYEGQGRLDGAVCEYEDAGKMAFLHRAHDLGVKNIEMEAGAFASFCLKCNIPGLDLCCTILDRLKGDQVDATPQMLSSYSENTLKVACAFIKSERQASKK